jgi:4'-phosphopantetheinyl transferase
LRAKPKRGADLGPPKEATALNKGAKLTLAHGEVHIWRIELGCTPSKIAALWADLSPEEQERASRVQLPKLRERWVVSRGALRRILGRYLHAPPGALKFRVGAYGKPELDWPHENISFNLAHSSDLALLAVVNSGRVGVDAELINGDVEARDISRSFFACAEADAILALPRDRRLGAFFATWTRKEAFVKALGGGLSLPLSRFVVTVRPEEPARLISVDWDDPSRWSLIDLSEPNVAAAVAVEGEQPILRRMQFAPHAA